MMNQAGATPLITAIEAGPTGRVRRHGRGVLRQDKTMILSLAADYRDEQEFHILTLQIIQFSRFRRHVPSLRTSLSQIAGLRP